MTFKSITIWMKTITIKMISVKMILLIQKSNHNFQKPDPILLEKSSLKIEAKNKSILRRRLSLAI